MNRSYETMNDEMSSEESDFGKSESSNELERILQEALNQEQGGGGEEDGSCLMWDEELMFSELEENIIKGDWIGDLVDQVVASTPPGALTPSAGQDEDDKALEQLEEAAKRLRGKRRKKKKNKDPNKKKKKKRSSNLPPDAPLSSQEQQEEIHLFPPPQQQQLQEDLSSQEHPQQQQQPQLPPRAPTSTHKTWPPSVILTGPAWKARPQSSPSSSVTADSSPSPIPSPVVAQSSPRAAPPVATPPTHLTPMWKSPFAPGTPPTSSLGALPLSHHHLNDSPLVHEQMWAKRMQQQQQQQGGWVTPLNQRTISAPFPVAPNLSTPFESSATPMTNQYQQQQQQPPHYHPTGSPYTSAGSRDLHSSYKSYLRQEQPGESESDGEFLTTDDDDYYDDTDRDDTDEEAVFTDQDRSSFYASSGGAPTDDAVIANASSLYNTNTQYYPSPANIQDHRQLSTPPKQQRQQELPDLQLLIAKRDVAMMLCHMARKHKRHHKVQRLAETILECIQRLEAIHQEEALSPLRRSLRRCRTLEKHAVTHQVMAATAHGYIGYARMNLQDHAGAIPSLETSLEIFQQLAKNDDDNNNNDTKSRQRRRKQAIVQQVVMQSLEICHARERRNHNLQRLAQLQQEERDRTSHFTALSFASSLSSSPKPSSPKPTLFGSYDDDDVHKDSDDDDDDEKGLDGGMSTSNSTNSLLQLQPHTFHHNVDKWMRDDGIRQVDLVHQVEEHWSHVAREKYVGRQGATRSTSTTHQKEEQVVKNENDIFSPGSLVGSLVLGSRQTVKRIKWAMGIVVLILCVPTMCVAVLIVVTDNQEAFVRQHLEVWMQTQERQKHVLKLRERMQERIQQSLPNQKAKPMTTKTTALETIQSLPLIDDNEQQDDGESKESPPFEWAENLLDAAVKMVSSKNGQDEQEEARVEMPTFIYPF